MNGQDRQHGALRAWVRSRLRVLGVLGLGVVVGTFGLLIWGRLRLVTGVPRTALAEPDRTPKAAQPHGPSASGTLEPGAPGEQLPAADPLKPRDAAASTDVDHHTLHID